jgi:LysM repeat protein
MKNARQLLWGIIIALVSIIFILGGVTLSLAEGNTLTRTQPPQPTSSPTLWIPPLQSATPSDTVFLPSITATIAATPTPIPATGTATPPPATSTATPAKTATKSATAAPVHTATATATTCGAPGSWGTYAVKPGDTLYALSQKFGITVSQLQQANCMGQSTLLKVGQKLRVPPGPPAPPLAATSTPGVPTPTPFPTVPTFLP